MLNKQILCSLRKWIESHPASNNGDDGIPYTWPVTSRMVDMAEECENHETRETVLNLLAVRGIFAERERVDLKAFVGRLLAIDRFDQMESILEQPSSNVSLLDLQSAVLDYCVQHVKPALFYDLSKVQDIDLTKCSTWMNLIRYFQRWLENPKDADLFSKVCRLNNDMLMEQSRLLGDDFWAEHPFVALFFNRNEATDIPLERILKSLPMMSNEFCHPAGNPSLYQLLAGEVPVNVRQFFLWRQEGGNVEEDIPHFSRPSLCSDYGTTVSIDWTFYLRQGRPFRAFCHAPGKENKEEMALYPFAVQAIAQEDPFNIPVSQSCVLFIEMMSRDSFPLRLTLSVLDRIVRESVDRARLTTLSRTLLTDANVARTLTNELEDILLKNWESASGMRLIDTWHQAVEFSKAYGVDLPVGFLHKCSILNDWLLSLVYVQRYNYPSKQYQAALRDFLPSCRRHLQLAIQLLDHSSTATSPSSEEPFYSWILKGSLSSSPRAIPFSVSNRSIESTVLTAVLDSKQIMPCLCLYLQFIAPEKTVFDPSQLNGETLGQLMQTLMSSGRFELMVEAFRIFIPDHLLTRTLNWLEDFRKGAAGREALQDLRDTISFSQTNDAFFREPSDSLLLAFRTCVWALKHVILDPELQLEMVALWSDIQPFTALAVSTEIPDFHIMTEMIALCLDSGIELDIVNMTEGSLLKECEKAIGTLLENHQFEVALKLAKLAGIH